MNMKEVSKKATAKTNLQSWREKNKPQMKKWRDKPQNKAKTKLRDKKYKQSSKGKELNKITQHKRRVNLKNAGSYTIEEINKLRRLSFGICPKCLKYFGDDLTIDHIKPISKGGDNTIKNIQLLCKSCNSSKGAK